MFVYDPDYTFEWPVKVTFPGADAPQEFTGVFRAPEDEKDIFEKVEGEDTPAMIDAARARIAKYWVGWRDIQVKGGGELEYSIEARDRLLANRAIRMAVDGALFEGLMGIREKN